MKLFRRYLRPLFFSRLFYQVFAAVIALFVISYALPALFVIAKGVLLGFALLVALDYIVLFSRPTGLKVHRKVPPRLSNGDENRIGIFVHNRYPFKVRLRIVDELPDQFQRRDFALKLSLHDSARETLYYAVRPTERGEYVFHDINAFVKSPLNLVVRRFQTSATQTVHVYPSYLHLRQYELLAHSNNLVEAGNRKIRKLGHSMEFEQIKEYVTGDDIRSINWKATARKGGQLMVNSYTDERSQPVYCLIDKGRVMKMPFNELTLLDYSINAALLLSRVALIRQDKAGLITFSDTIGHFIPADRKAGQMTNILESLYNQHTNFGESDYEKLFALIRTRITQRSLIILFTNFESMSGLQRQLPYLRSLARNHLLLVVFFENTELRDLTEGKVTDIESLYIRTIAEKFAYEKRLIVKELQKHGIFTILTPSENLTVNTINKYLELKARQAI